MTLAHVIGQTLDVNNLDHLFVLMEPVHALRILILGHMAASVPVYESIV